MKHITKRTLALLMSLMLMVSLFVGVAVPAQAAGNVTYKYSGSYVYNWGTRDTVATFLSPMAEDFYEDNGVTYDQLASYAGHSSTSSVPSSNLYKQLQNLMKNNHDHETSYNETRDLYKYTDCQNNGSPSSISSFYSGKAIGPAWDGGATWNREHTWPNSKGDASGNGENDIMMLRPTASSENSSRGNKAYGESGGTSYYDPNGLGQKVRGDVARIMLFVYVRWGNTGNMWGSSGVMESKAVLLKWMQEDPVDTWELGRNDATEAITGTRNVFVDYPELAFELFETAIPDGYQTPSGKAAGGNTPNNPDQPDIPTPDVPSTGDGVVTNPQVGVPYKLGLNNGSGVYYFTGSIVNNYYGGTDTSVDAAVDVYLEQTDGGYHLAFNNGGTKQYINVTQNNTYYNFTIDATANCVFALDTTKNALHTQVGDKDCYLGNYGDYTSINVLKSARDTDYIARLYGANGAGGTTPDTPDAPVKEPAANSYLTVAEAVALGATKTKDVYTEGKYYVTGTIKSVEVGVFGNMTITDGAGNDLYVYGTYSADGEIGYGSLNPKPVVGDTITLYGPIGMYNEPQMKSGWIVAYIPGPNPDQPSVSGGATISFADTANRTEYTSSKQVWEMDGITVTNNKASSTTNVGDYANPGRFYKGSSVTIEYPGMKKLVIQSQDGSAYSKDYTGPWADSFSDANASADINGIEVTITFTNPVDSFTWTSMTGQARAYSIEVFDGSEDANHTHEYDNDCDAVCNTCDAVRIATHVYDDNFDATCNKCGAERPIAEPEAPECNHIWMNGACNICGIVSPSKVEITSESATAGYAKMGDKVKASITAEGDGLTYTWYLKNDGGTKYSKSSVTSATYSTTMSDKVKGRRVYCIVTDQYGNKVQSKTFILRESVSVTKEPATAAYAKKGATVKVKITASGDGLKYQWYIKNDGKSTYSKSSVTSATYSTTMSSSSKGRRIYCVVTDKYGKKVQSKTFILREAVSITKEPATATYAKNGATAKVTITASGDGLKYQWYVKNAGSSKYSKSSITKSTYSVKMSDKVNGRRIYCVVTDKYGKTVQSKTMILKKK